MSRKRKQWFCIRVIELRNGSIKDSFRFSAVDYESACTLGYQQLKRRVGYDKDNDVQDLIRFFEAGGEGHMAGYDLGDTLPGALQKIRIEVVPA